MRAINKKILICSLNDRIGGAEQILKMIAIYYLRNGYQVDIFFLSMKLGKLWDDLNGKANLFYTNSKKEYQGVIQFYRNIRKRKYEYAYTSHIYLNSFIGLLRKLNKINIKYLIGRDSRSYFLVNHGVKRYIYISLINIGYSGLDLLICQTDEMKNQFIANNNILSNKIKIKTIRNPIDLNFQESHLIDENELCSEYNYIVSAGRLIKIKGFDFLIKAFSVLKLDNYKLLIFGEGNERQNLEKLIVELNLKNKVELKGFVNNVFFYFKQAKICVVSSIKEGFPNVLLQMMSQNEKVVSTLCAGEIDQIKGLFTCEPNNESSLAKSMKSCLDSDTTENRKLFNKELEGRSIDMFIDKINFYLEH